MLQPVLIVVKVLQGDGFRTDITAAKWIVLVSTNVQTLVRTHRNPDAADRFAEIAITIMRSACHDMDKRTPRVSVRQRNKSNYKRSRIVPRIASQVGSN